jgi:hypothetical protein
VDDWGLSPFSPATRSAAAKTGLPPSAFAADDSDGQTASADEPRELTYVDIDTFEATF